VFGALATGVFASKAINPAGADGLIYGNFALLKTQFIAVGATVAFAGLGTAVILFALKAVMDLRVSPEDERMGLDLSQHSESAYTFSTDYDEPTPQWAMSQHKSVAIANPVLEEN
jgi:Amt family ammonium transporter